jgi:pimeloyl-ACP methyl ester carboxylesterase
VRKRIKKIWRWVKRIVFIIIAIPVIILVGVRVYGGLKMRKSDKEIEAFLLKNNTSGVIDTLRTRNRNIVYLKTTNGKKHKDAIVFVHGSPGSLDAFLEYMTDTTLLSLGDLITYDRPGFGHSGFGKSVKSLSGHANILSDLLSSLHYERYWLVGHSYGGPIIIYMAMRHPGKIAGLCVIAGSVSPELEPKAKWRKWFDLPLLRHLWPVSLRVSNDELMPLRHDLRMIEDDWDRVHVPVSLIHGTLDVLVPFGNVAYAKEKLIHADTVREYIFEGENHFIVWSHKDKVINEIASLVRGDKSNKKD